MAGVLHVECASTKQVLGVWSLLEATIKATRLAHDSFYRVSHKSKLNYFNNSPKGYLTLISSAQATAPQGPSSGLMPMIIKMPINNQSESAIIHWRCSKVYLQKWQHSFGFLLWLFNKRVTVFLQFFFKSGKCDNFHIVSRQFLLHKLKSKSTKMSCIVTCLLCKHAQNG